MRMIDGHAHACGMLLDTKGVIKYLDNNHISKIILSAGEPNSNKVYKIPYLSKVFKSSNLIYFNNALTVMAIRISKMHEHLDEGNEKVARMAEECPERIMNTYWVNPLEDNCIEKMLQFKKRHLFSMIKMHQCWTPFDIQDKRFLAVIDWASHHDVPVFIHIKSKAQVKKFITLTKRYPNVTFILAHLIGIEEFDQSIGDHVYADLSCSLLHSVKMLKRAFDIFGSERILLGSDAPYGHDNINLAIRQMGEAGLSDRDMERICSKNIEKVLGL